MPLINVVKTFRLNLGTRIHEFAAGVHEVEEDIASHFYVLLHAERVTEPTTVAPEAETVAAPEPPAQDPPEETAGPESSDVSVTEEPDGTVHVDTPEEVDEKSALQAQAEGLGIAIDRRWGVDRLQKEIAAKSAA